MADFQLPDPKKTSGKVLGIGLLAAAGLAFYAYILPWLLTIVWGTAELIAGAIVTGILLAIVTSKKFWRRCNIILSALGELAFGWFINMNPFSILMAQVSSKEKDREDLFEQCKKLKAQDDKLTTQLEEENSAMQLAVKKIQMCKEKLASNPTDEDTAYQLESASNDFTNSKDFIDKVGPIQRDIKRLVVFADKAYRKSGFALQNAKNTITKQRAAYDAVTTGSNAMKKALRAFTGNPEMNKAADMALAKLRDDISQKIGAITQCIQATSVAMNERDLNDAAKVALAADKAETIDINTFDYVAALPDSNRMAVPVTANKWLNQLNK